MVDGGYKTKQGINYSQQEYKLQETVVKRWQQLQKRYASHNDMNFPDSGRITM